jgi:hypothetical protein
MAIDTATIAKLKNMILLEIGEQNNSSGPVYPNIDDIWDLSVSGYTDSSQRYQYLLVKRKAIEITLGAIWRGNYIRVGNIQMEKLDDKKDFLQAEKKSVEAELSSHFEYGRLLLDFNENITDEFE